MPNSVLIDLDKVPPGDAHGYIASMLGLPRSVVFQTIPDLAMIAPSGPMRRHAMASGYLQVRGRTVSWVPIAPFPAIADQAGSLISAGGAILARIASGNHVLSSREVKANRLALCESCPELRENWRCGKCGCFTRIKAKAESSKCPIGKW